ncbi:MAG: hypothetical protein M9892_04170 [Bacteroidetes bacterium]|nr:hypothetical protein [Bacteroidota bacterium]
MHPLTSYLPKAQSGFLYYPFGSSMMSYSNAEFSYSFGQNGQLKDDEIFEGAYSAEYWMYDSRLGRRWNNDPKPNPSVSVYACFGNNPIWFTDVAGDTTVFVNTIELKKGYSEANKDKGWTEEQMNKNFDAYKNRLFKDLELMYRDNNLNVVVEETTLTFDQIKLNETDHYISFESFYSHGVRGVNFSNRSVIYYSEFTEAMKNNSTLVMSNSIVHETGHGYLKAIKFNWGLDNKCLLINRDDHTVESKVGQNLMLSGSERFLSSYEKGLPKSYADLRKSKDPKYKDIKDKYLFIGFHQYYFSAYLLRYKTEPINIYKHQN